ncbi:MAG: glycosyl transferase, partial [Ferruginibacter sp.]|nr:glycosyl transferase [Ferruginibacter sp.]
MLLPSKFKILILIDWFYPGYKAGGPIQSVLNLIKVLKSNYELFILTTDTDHGENQPYQNIVSDQWIWSEVLGVNIFYANKKNLSTKQVKKQILYVAPDFIYLNHLYSPMFVLYPLWLKLNNRIKSKVIICPRGALYASAIAVKSYKKKPLLLLMKLFSIQKKISFHATNEREKKAIEDFFPGAD